MELRQLHYFIAVAEELSVTRAARSLHISQPPLSRQIQQLESELGVQLFDRTGGRLRLTDAGRFLHEHAKRLVTQASEIRDTTRRIAQTGNRWLNIGFSPSALYGLLPAIIRSFRLVDPNIEIGLTDLTSGEQIQALKSGRIDVGFGRIVVSDAAITCVIIEEEPLVAVVPTGHRLERSKSLTLATLAMEHMILFPVQARAPYGHKVLEHFRAKGLTVTSTREVHDLQSALGLVAAGVGVTLVPWSIQRRRDVRYKPIADPGVTSPVVMTYREGEESAAVRTLIEEVQRTQRASGLPLAASPGPRPRRRLSTTRRTAR